MINVGLQVAISEWLYQRYGMSSKGMVYRVLMGIFLGSVLFFLSELSTFEKLRISSLVVVLLYVSIVDFLKCRIPNTMLVQVLLTRSIVFIFEIETLLDSFVGFLVWLGVLFLIHKVTKEGIGAGDVKLIAVIGYCIGMMHSMLVLLIACMMIVVYGVIRIIFRRQAWRNVLPMAPFLFVGFVVFLLHSIIVIGGI